MKAKIGALFVAMGLICSVISGCETKDDDRKIKIRPQPVWSDQSPKPKKKKRSPKPVVSCSPGDKRWVCPR